MATRAQDRRGAEAMSCDIDAKLAKRRKDPLIERLEASRSIAHKERDAALAKAAELEAELNRARRCLRSARAAFDLQREQWESQRADLKFRLNFAAEHIRKLQTK